ncbi:putative alpha-L-arabinofuranosidase A [Lasiodiplodia hormozganensis]|uniref:non-reducing end alpha-L-arabinofuranosidase n=1 Tax=Lasiodiplodia hormozganensis TaxID=869390 RepID=A0AA39Y2D0_9PEZI|nr:putative alpha-L-arabinofuranosidase A [Lasiodiplodia hormozganensis]
MHGFISSITGLAAGAALVGHAAGINLNVHTSGGNATSPFMYGFMFEDINHSGDGGITGQLLRNNGFQGDDQTLTAYGAVGDTTLSVDSGNPLTSAIPHSLAVAVPDGSTGQVGFSNEGYWGILVNADVYFSSFFIKGDYSGQVTIKLVGKDSGTEYASHSIDVSSNGGAYTYYQCNFPVKQAPDGNNLWTLTFDGGKTAGSTLHFDLVTLYPTTFHNRPNGLQPAIANVLDDMGGTFLRFPGGNNLEGVSPENRWKWNETLGPLQNRPGRQGTWTYPNTDALGLVEYFEWCIDMKLTPVLGVWAGFALGSGGNTPITGNALTPYVNDVMDELEFILGDQSTQYGALRASLGYPEPFTLQHVEIGNEDNLGGGCASYPERFNAFHQAITAAYPSLTIIASTADPNCLPATLPAGTWADYHNYADAPDLVSNFSQFDQADRSIPIFVGEFSTTYATQTEEDSADRDHYPYMGGSVAEAVYMLGFERNADVIKMGAYAPLLQLYNASQWTPNLIPFTQNPGGVVRTTSYYVQQLFAKHWGSTTRAVDADTGFGPLYWAASANSGGQTFLKIANYGNAAQSVTARVEGATSATLITLSGAEDAQNTIEDGESVVPVTTTPSSDGNGGFELQIPAWCVAVLVVNGGSQSAGGGDTTSTSTVVGTETAASGENQVVTLTSTATGAAGTVTLTSLATEEAEVETLTRTTTRTSTITAGGAAAPTVVSQESVVTLVSTSTRTGPPTNRPTVSGTRGWWFKEGGGPPGRRVRNEGSGWFGWWKNKKD